MRCKKSASRWNGMKVSAIGWPHMQNRGYSEVCLTEGCVRCSVARKLREKTQRAMLIGDLGEHQKILRNDWLPVRERVNIFLLWAKSFIFFWRSFSLAAFAGLQFGWATTTSRLLGLATKRWRHPVKCLDQGHKQACPPHYPFCAESQLGKL